MDENKFEGKFLGNLGELFGVQSTIEIDETDCWLNHSRNILLEINNKEHRILCSSNLSDLIRKNKLDEKTEELKKFAVYEFKDGGKYVTHLIESNAQKNKLKEKEKIQLERIILVEEYLKALNENIVGLNLVELEESFRKKEAELTAELEMVNKELDDL